MVKTSQGEKWRSISFQGENILITPLEVKSEELPNCDSKGNLLEKKQLQKAEYKFYDKEGKEYNGEIFKLQNGEAVSKTTATKEILTSDLEKDTLNLESDLIVDKIYLVKASENFQNKIRQLAIKEKKLFKFPFDSGFGYKRSKAIIVFDTNLKRLLIYVGRYKKSILINDIETLQTQKQKAIAEVETLKAKVKRVKNDSKV